MSFKRLTTVVLTCAMVLTMAGCSKSIPDVGKKDFMKACDKAGYDDYMISEFDEEYDEIEVTVSGNAIIDYAIQYSDLVEIIRPRDLRNKLIDKINSIQKKYTDNK